MPELIQLLARIVRYKLTQGEADVVQLSFVDDERVGHICICTGGELVVVCEYDGHS